jgi:predicted transcriptional regulator
MTRTPKSKLGKVNKFAISLSPEATAKLEAFCRKHERARSWALEKLVNLYLDKLEKLP